MSAINAQQIGRRVTRPVKNIWTDLRHRFNQEQYLLKWGGARFIMIVESSAIDMAMRERYQQKLRLNKLGFELCFLKHQDARVVLREIGLRRMGRALSGG